jgi:hypothetical protein
MSDVPDPKDVEEQRSDTFTRTVAMTVAAYAVALAVTSLGGGNCGKDVMLDQQQASNAWAYYQAKVIRENLYKIEKQDLEFQLAAHGDQMSSAGRAHAERLMAECAASEAKYKQEKEEIMADAKKYEKSRDDGMQRDPYFDYGEVFLQIAIVMASIAMLSGSLPAYLFSLVLAVGGAVFSANGFFLFMEVPGL